VNIEEARLLARAAKEHNVRTMVGTQGWFAPAFVKVRCLFLFSDQALNRADQRMGRLGEDREDPFDHLGRHHSAAIGEPRRIMRIVCDKRSRCEGLESGYGTPRRLLFRRGKRSALTLRERPRSQPNTLGATFLDIVVGHHLACIMRVLGDLKHVSATSTVGHPQVSVASEPEHTPSQIPSRTNTPSLACSPPARFSVVPG